jgi:hypothetical protein
LQGLTPQFFLHVPEREDISEAEWIKRVKALDTKPDQFLRSISTDLY